MSMFPEKSSASSQMPTTQSAKMEALRHVFGSPSWKFAAAWDSITWGGRGDAGSFRVGSESGKVTWGER